jgi:hypothetical protein
MSSLHPERPDAEDLALISIPQPYRLLAVGAPTQPCLSNGLETAQQWTAVPRAIRTLLRGCYQLLTSAVTTGGPLHVWPYCQEASEDTHLLRQSLVPSESAPPHHYGARLPARQAKTHSSQSAPQTDYTPSKAPGATGRCRRSRFQPTVPRYGVANMTRPTSSSRASNGYRPT